MFGPEPEDDWTKGGVFRRDEDLAHDALMIGLTGVIMQLKAGKVDDEVLGTLRG